MSNILIINGAKQFEHSNGELNDTLTQFSESQTNGLTFFTCYQDIHTF